LQSSAVVGLHDRLTELTCVLHAAEILDCYSVPKSLSFIRDCRSNPVMIEHLMTGLARSVDKR